MKKKVYSPKFNEVLLDNFLKLKDIYQNNISDLSIDVVKNTIEELLISFEEIEQIEFDSYRRDFSRHFSTAVLDVSFKIDSQSFINEFKNNNSKKFVYIYFISNSGKNVNLGFRFTDKNDLKDDLHSKYSGETFYIINGNILKPETQEKFASYVSEFHKHHDRLLESKEVVKTKYVKDDMLEAMNFINLNPQNIEIFPTVKANKLSTSIVSDISGVAKYHNRGVQWP